MSDHSAFESDSRDEPLFVLKYRLYWKFVLISLFSFLVFLSGMLAFVLPAKNTTLLVCKPVYGLLAFWFLLQTLGIMLFSGIRLYRERIVKEWRLIGSTEIQLADASLLGGNFGGTSGKTFFNRGAGRWLLWLQWLFPIRGVSYIESFALPDRVKELNRLLADLSGRNVEEFQATNISIPRLIKEDGA
jgi:hypothetical protein